jgi:hypothetical protein
MFFWAFLIGVAVDSVPVFAPPAWTLLAILIIRYRANPYGVLVFGVAGSALGRFFLSLYSRRLSFKFLNHAENLNLEYVGKMFEGGFWKTSLFVFLYTLTPLSTTSLFTAAGSGRVNVLSILPAFALGKLISDGAMIFTARHAARNVRAIFRGQASPNSLLGAGLGLVLVAALLFIDWRSLIENKTLKMRFQIWKQAGPR